MNKITWIGMALLLVFVVVFAYSQLSSASVKPSNDSITVVEPVHMPEHIEPYEHKAADITDGAHKYRILSGSTVSYVALKKFFNKPEESVTGVTDQVSGEGWFNYDDSNGYVKTSINIDTLKSGNDKRDIDVQQLFTDKNVTFSTDITQDMGIKLGQPFDTYIPGKITINGVTKEVKFKVNGTIDEEELIVLGTTTIKMSDFGINPPSLINVFTADDNLELKFDIKGEHYH